ncbi:MAG: hypothetical protein CTY35_12105 [Methylotenera sp.]|jgi:biopolymer transport protein ExbB/TolQ|uniref:hypothetical protein n=1 Tax=Methylotenera sp. TaxID=2051956 RepID=UPI000D4AD4DA|nr:hypothetical protein [Methylotenera sp.]PPC79870.1 MAG: hypothetical protein CTY38_12235 [Methylotenera sp.]PPC92748.1 MAG: hypothetical protein CTY35_12105 [Methylotenera sp.]
MNGMNINRLLAISLICIAGFASSAIAGMDEAQRQLIQRVTKAKQVQQQAQAAQGTERQKLLENHMKMMHENMDSCRSMKPKAGLTDKERDEWFAEHQKMMGEIMDQMMIDYKLIVESSGDSMDSHKH